MNIRPLLIDATVKNRANEIIKWAEEHPYSDEDVQGVLSGTKEKAGHFDEFTMHISLGYRVVFSMENVQGLKLRHISVSVDEVGACPSEIAVNAIMILFKFKVPVHRADKIDMEKIGENHYAVNVWEIINSD